MNKIKEERWSKNFWNRESWKGRGREKCESERRVGKPETERVGREECEEGKRFGRVQGKNR